MYNEFVRVGEGELTHMENDELAHIGVIGMKWGTKRGGKKSVKLNKQADKSIRKFDKGKRMPGDTFRNQSATSRKLTFKTNKRIARMEKYLAKAAKQPAGKKVSAFGKNPVRVAKVKGWLAENQQQKMKLSELRSKLVDVKIDTL